MVTTVISKVGIAGGPTRDYSSLQAWEDASPANLVTADQIWKAECYNDGGPLTATGNCLQMGGQTTDATRYLWLTTAAGQSFRDNASVQTNPLRYDATKGVGITHTSPIRQWTVACNTAYTLIENVQILAAPDSYYGSTPLFLDQVYDGSGHDITVKNCIIEQDPTVGSAGRGSNAPLAIADTPADNITLINCVIVQRSASVNNSSPGISGFASGQAFNCIVIATQFHAVSGSAFSGRRYNGGNANLTNCAAFGFPSVQNGTGGTHTNCMSDTATNAPTGWTTGKTFANQFQNIADATRDFRLKSGADLIDAGATSSNASPDIAGTTRPSGTAYDIGPWEFVSGGGGTLTGVGSAAGISTMTAEGTWLIDRPGPRVIVTQAIRRSWHW
jgi:hypothetical protein